MARIFLEQAGQFFARFFQFGGTIEMALGFLDDDAFMKWMVQASKQWLDTNPFEQSVEETLNTLREQNIAGNWCIPEETFIRLAETAPAWPKGRHAFRSLRIRFGEGTEGVAQTFIAHAAAMRRVLSGPSKACHHKQVIDWMIRDHGDGGKLDPRAVLRLRNGNETHHAVIEWIIISDLSAYVGDKSRHPNSLADEGVVLAWLFPKRTGALTEADWKDWRCSGYELNLRPWRPNFDQEWANTFTVHFDRTLNGAIGITPFGDGFYSPAPRFT